MRITLFEPHFEGAQIGPQTLGGAEAEEEIEDDTSGSVLGTAIGLVMLAGLVVAAVYALRQNGADVPVDLDETDLPPVQ